MKPREPVSLTTAAEQLGVHYMTAYRYVRTGRLPATKDGSQWRVDPDDIDRLRDGPPIPSRRGSREQACQRLERRMIAGDTVGSWTVIEQTLASGATAAEIHLDVLVPALREIGARWANGELSVADEHRASATAQRLLGRLGPRFAHHGRTRGTIVIGAPAGDAHALPSAIMSDLLRDRRFAVIDLGADAPPDSFVDAASEADRLRAVCIGASGAGRDDAIVETVAALRDHGLEVPVLVGGGAIRDAEHASQLGASGWTGADARSAIETIESIATRPRTSH